MGGKKIWIQAYEDLEEECIAIQITYITNDMKAIGALAEVDRDIICDVLKEMFKLHIKDSVIVTYDKTYRRFKTLVSMIVDDPFCLDVFARWLHDNYKELCENLLLEKKILDDDLRSGKRSSEVWYGNIGGTFECFVARLYVLYDICTLLHSRVPEYIINNFIDTIKHCIGTFLYHRFYPPTYLAKNIESFHIRMMLRSIASYLTLIKYSIDAFKIDIDRLTNIQLKTLPETLLDFCKNMVEYSVELFDKVSCLSDAKRIRTLCMDIIISAKELSEYILMKYNKLYKKYKYLLPYIEDKLITLKLSYITSK